MKKNIVITIDGPAGSGKSTAAKQVAKRLGISYIDSGAIYRTYTLQFLKNNVNIHDEKSIDKILAQTEIGIDTTNNGCLFFLNGQDVTKEIRTLEITRKVSVVSKLPQIRKVVTQFLRKLAENKSVVLEGRDIGSVVFPDADLKIYLDAAIKERAERRYKELVSSDEKINIQGIESEISKRDQHDTERKISPLIKPDDAIVLNNTHLSIEEGVDFIENAARKIMQS